MKNELAIATLLLILFPARFWAADEAAVAAANADRQYWEERFKSLNSAVNDLIASQTNLLMRLDQMGDDLRRVAGEVEKLKATTAGYAKAETVEALSKQVTELDRNREADKALILSNIAQLATSPILEPHGKRSPGAGSENPNEYIVQKDDTLSMIVIRLRREGRRVTLKDILEANRGVSERNLRIGQKLIIPEGRPPNREP